MSFWLQSKCLENNISTTFHNQAAVKSPLSINCTRFSHESLVKQWLSLFFSITINNIMIGLCFHLYKYASRTTQFLSILGWFNVQFVWGYKTKPTFQSQKVGQSKSTCKECLLKVFHWWRWICSNLIVRILSSFSPSESTTVARLFEKDEEFFA